MKTKLQFTIVLMAILCLSTSTGFAKIWRVNNRANIAADFTTAQAAHDGATAGDTIYFEPSPNNYGDFALSKQLFIIGTGYFLDANPETQWINNWPSTLNQVSFNAGSEYSQLMGVTFTGSCIVSATNITIKRNYFHNEIQLAASYIEFVENFCSRSGLGYNMNAASCINMANSIHDIIINNNIFYFSQGGYNNSHVSITGSIAYNGSFSNNVVSGYVSTYNGSPCGINIENFVVQNNILSTMDFATNSNDYSFNIANNTAFGNQNSNQQNVDMGTVFLYTGSTDGQFQLKEGSPAIGAGTGGVDCGAFGGLNPYVLSGLPPVPAIYHFTLGGSGSQYNVSVKVKSHN